MQNWRLGVILIIVIDSIKIIVRYISIDSQELKDIDCKQKYQKLDDMKCSGNVVGVEKVLGMPSKIKWWTYKCGNYEQNRKLQFQSFFISNLYFTYSKGSPKIVVLKVTA